jgi:hypothetical protein
MFRFNITTLLLFFSCIGHSLAIDTVNNNFAKDFIIGLAVAAAATIVFTILVCACALCGPSLIGRCCFGRARHPEENWFDARDEEKRNYPFVQSNNTLLMPGYA